MNGNELANVLRWPKGQEYQHEWYAGQQLPEEWWKSDFPYGEAERMGYKLSPEETKKFYERKKKEKEKTLSEELADILKRPEVKMLDPLQRADLIDKIAKAQAVIAKREEEREKHEAAQLEIGRQTQMQDRVKAILQSDRVPAQKVTALTMAGISLGDARDMVWGKRGAEGEAKTPSRGAGAAPSPEGRAPTGASARRISGYVGAAETGEYSPAELIAALVGEGIGSEAAQTIASTITAKDLTPEQEIAKTKAGLEEAEYYRGLAVKREHPEMFVPLEERKFELELKETLSTINLDWAKFGHTKDTDYETAKLAREKFLLDVKKYGFDVAKQKSSDEQWWADFGLKDRESQQLAIRETKKLALDIEKFGLEKTVKRHGMEMKAGELKLNIKKEENVMTKWKEKKKQWTKTFGAERADKMFDQKMRGLEYEADVDDAERTHKLNVEKFGEEKADNMRTYQLDKLKEDRALKESLFDMGFKREEFVEKAAQFWGTLTETKEERKERARQYDTTEERLREENARAADEFEKELKLEYTQLDLDVKQFGLNTEIEARIAKMALLNFGLDKQRYGLDEAIHKFEVADADKKWYWREKEWPLKQDEALRKWKEIMHRITQDAKQLGFDKAVQKEKSRQWQEEFDWDKEQAKQKEGMVISAGLASVLDEAFGENKGRVISAFKNLKPGYKPAAKELDDLYSKLFGIDEFGLEVADGESWVELDGPEFCKKVWGHTKWNDTFKCWVISKRDDPDWWNAQLLERGTVVEPGIADVPKDEEGPVWWKPTTWFGKKDIVGDAQTIMNGWGRPMIRAELKGALIEKGYSESDIAKLWDKLRKGK